MVDSAPTLQSQQDGRTACEAAQTLRKQLEVLMESVNRMSTSSIEAGGAGQSACTDSGAERHLDLCPGSASKLPFTGSQAAREKKAPSPRQWLMEPLAVMVGRCDHSDPASGSPVK